MPLSEKEVNMYGSLTLGKRVRQLLWHLNNKLKICIINGIRDEKAYT